MAIFHNKSQQREIHKSLIYLLVGVVVCCIPISSKPVVAGSIPAGGDKTTFKILVLPDKFHVFFKEINEYYN